MTLVLVCQGEGLDFGRDSEWDGQIQACLLVADEILDAQRGVDKNLQGECKE